MAGEGRIKFDVDGERLFEAGVDQVCFYPMNSSGEYPMGYGWNGVTGITESPEGAEPTDLWADNIKYASLMSAETWKGSIEAYMYPPEFEQCDGSINPIAGVSFGQQERKKFGLCYRTKIGSDADGTEHGYKLHLVYGLLASPSEKGYETINDSPDAITFSWDVNSTPAYAGESYKPVSTITIDSTVVTEEKMTALETALYGTDPTTGTSPTPGTAPYLPSPEDVIDILSA